MGKTADQALERQLAEIRSTKARIESDVHGLSNSTNDVAGTVMSLAGSGSGSRSGGGGGGSAAAAAKDAAPKALAAIGALGATLAVAGRKRKQKAATKARDAERRSARIRAEELARAFGTITPAGADALVANEPLPAPPPAEPAASRPDSDDDGGRGGRGLGVVLLVAVAAGAAVWFNGRR